MSDILNSVLSKIFLVIGYLAAQKRTFYLVSKVSVSIVSIVIVPLVIISVVTVSNIRLG